MLVEYSLLRGLLGRVSRCLGTAGALWDIYKKGAFPLAVFFFSFPHAHSTFRIVLKDIKQVPKVQVSYTNTQSSIIATTPHNITMSSKDSNEPTTNGTTAPSKKTGMICPECDYVPDFDNFTLERLDTDAHGQRCGGVGHTLIEIFVWDLHHHGLCWNTCLSGLLVGVRVVLMEKGFRVYRWHLKDYLTLWVTRGGLGISVIDFRMWGYKWEGMGYV